MDLSATSTGSIPVILVLLPDAINTRTRTDTVDGALSTGFLSWTTGSGQR